MENKGFLWIDLETTGLNKKTDQILEVACIFTDYKLQHLSSFHSYMQWDNEMDKVDQFVKDMHTVTGLWDKLEQAPSAPTHIVDSAIYDWLHNLCDIYNIQMLFMAGSSVGQFDMSFFERDFPLARKLLHYRVFDVTSLKILAEMCGHIMDEEKKFQPEHVAMNDVQNSLAYARQFFNPFTELATYASHVGKTME